MNQLTRRIAGLLLIGLILSSISSKTQAQNFPPLTVTIHDSAATVGYYFISPYINTPPWNYDHPLMVLDRYGRTVFYRWFPGAMNANVTNDFKIQYDGRISFFNTTSGKFFIMDSTFTVVDSIGCANGFQTDSHDLQILPDHHYLLLGRETRIMNLTSYHWFGPNHTTPGGANAQVVGVVIQEFDENKSLIWEWKGHDHYAFGEVDSVWLSTPNMVSWTHANAVERDRDGNILLSLRHFDEISKINRTTGNFIWRMGGKANQFTFLNDPVRYTGQHDIRRVSDTSISIFDNGQYTNPVMSRGLEYALNETTKTARLVWEYIYDSSMFSGACGNHQYISNGNHLIDYGFTNAGPWMVVVKPDKSLVMELSYPDGYISYRAFNYPELPWLLNRPAVNCERTGDNYYLVAESGHSSYKWSTGETSQRILITSAGNYWVFVPYGDGFISSEIITVTDPLHPCIPVGMADEKPAQPGLLCHQEPGSSKVQILFELPEGGKAEISVRNLLGQQISGPYSGIFNAGKHEAILDLPSATSGLCFVTLETGGIRKVRKLMAR